MTYQKQVRVKQVLNGYVVSTAAYKEIIYKDLEDVIQFLRNHFTNRDEQPKRYYGKKDSDS